MCETIGRKINAVGSVTRTNTWRYKMRMKLVGVKEILVEENESYITFFRDFIKGTKSL